MTGPGWSRSRCASSVSIMGLPTKTTRSPVMPSAARLTSPSGAVTKSGSLSRSVTRRLTSSGMVGSKERRPASTCATGMSSLAHTSAAASVELTSP